MQTILFKKTLSYLSVFALAAMTFSTSAIASGHGEGKGMGKNAEFKYAVKHSNFMPTLMAVVMKNKQSLDLSSDQMQQLKAYHAKNSPSQREDMKNVVKLEQQAAKMALTGDLNQAQKLGQQSIALRQTIMNQKIRCHQMMQKVLTKQQLAKVTDLAK